MDFDMAVSLANGHGVGIVLPQGIVCLDIDRGLDEYGTPLKQFRKMVNAAETYTEVSASGRGLHIFYESAEIPDGEAESHTFEDGSKLEVLGTGKFVKVTGHRYGDKPATVADGTGVVEKALKFVRDQKPKPNGIARRTETTFSDDEVLRLIRRAENAAKFADLFDDGNSTIAPYHGDESRADLGLISMLAFYTQNEAQLDRLFRESALYRNKWDEKRGHTTYGSMTINKALSDLSETYSPPGQHVLNRALDRAISVAEANVNAEELALGFSTRLPIHTYMRDGIEPPKLLIEDVLYAGTSYEDGSTEGVVHTWYGEPGCGKSMLALWASFMVMRLGLPVVYIDEEGTRRMVTERLQGLGAAPEEIEQYFYYFNSTSLAASNRRHQQELDYIAQTVRPELVVFDSWIDFLATDGRSENSSDEVVGWAQLVSRSFIAVGSTVVLLDHIPKDGSGRGARGSGGKLGWVTAGHKVEVKSPFNRDLTGEVKLIRQKDREGALPHVVYFTIGGDGRGRITCRPDASVITSHDDDGLTPNMRDALEALPTDGAGFNAWFAASGISSKDSFNNAVKGLLSRGRVKKSDKTYYVTDPEDDYDGISF
jgi:putative DNA primase/helicase